MGRVLTAIDLSIAVADLTSTAQAHEVATRILLDVGETAGALEDLAAGRPAPPRPAGTSRRPRPRCGPWPTCMPRCSSGTRPWSSPNAYRETARLLGDPVAESAAIETVSFIYGGMAVEAADRGDHERAADWHEQTVVLSGPRC